MVFTDTASIVNDTALNPPIELALDSDGIPDTYELALPTETGIGIRMVNLQHSGLVPFHKLDFVIQHRFGPFNSGGYNLYGLDQSTIRFGLEYGLRRDVTLGLGRSNFGKTYNGFAKWKMSRQADGAFADAVLLSDIAVNGSKYTGQNTPYYFTHRLLFTNQLILGKYFLNRKLYGMVSPTVVHRNLVDSVKNPNDLLYLGLAVRYKLSHLISVTAEYNYSFNHDFRISNQSAAGLGIEFNTAGHVFQIVFSNTTALNEAKFLTADNGNIAKGGFGLGFNIVRRW